MLVYLWGQLFISYYEDIQLSSTDLLLQLSL